MAISVLIDSGALTSSAFTLARADRAFTIACASQGTASAVFVEYATSSGQPPWFRLQQANGSGAAFCAHSGTGNAAAIVPSVASPWLRLAVTSGPSSPMSYFVTEMVRAG